MLRGFERHEPQKTSNTKKNINERRELVIRTIEDWIAHLEGRKPARKPRPLSKIENGRRYVWLLYSQNYIELLEDGSNRSWIDIKDSEIDFWRNHMIPWINTGKYDTGINKAADKFTELGKIMRLGKHDRKKTSII
jgi:hypothetical protein